MSYGGMSTHGFPSLGSYAQARKHFDSVRPWDSKYNQNNERPIGERNVKTCGYGYYGERFNKAMRELDDGSIAFRLYQTDCVIWHPDNTLTIQGYMSMSTSCFIGMLAPENVSHQIGRKNWDEPVLHLRGIYPSKAERALPWEQSRSIWRDYWNSGMIIQCSRPVRLRRTRKLWLPVKPDELTPFEMFRVDRAAARRASAKYHLSELHQIVNAAIALAGRPVLPPTQTSGSMDRIMAALREEQYLTAVSLMPRGGGSTAFGRRMVASNELTPGYLQQLRNHIYECEGALESYEERTLTPGQYKRYVADQRRFG